MSVYIYFLLRYAGATVPLSFTLGYAAPEVAIALAEGSELVIAECAMDAWAIGVIAFELLTGRSAFKMFRGKQDVRFHLPRPHLCPQN